MKKQYFVGFLTFTVLLTGCASTAMNSKTGFAAVSMAKEAGVATGETGSKTGRACSTNYAGVYAAGDSSIEAGKKAGGISKVASVDYEYFTILGFYAQVCAVVKGN